MSKSKQIAICLQILLWVWFGTITSFCAANVVNVAKLEVENKLLKEDIILLKKNKLIK
jgi:hypothetical protein